MNAQEYREALEGLKYEELRQEYDEKMFAMMRSASSPNKPPDTMIKELVGVFVTYPETEAQLAFSFGIPTEAQKQIEALSTIAHGTEESAAAANKSATTALISAIVAVAALLISILQLLWRL